MADPTFPDPDANRREFWEPIGQFVMEFGFLERQIDGVIWQAMFLHEMQGEALTSQIKNLSTRILLAKQLLMILHIEVSQPKRIAEVMKAVSELNSFRNNLVHGPWGLYDMTHHDVKHHFWEKTKVDGSNFKPKTFRVKRQDVLDNIKRVRETREVLAKLTGSIVCDFLREIEHVPWPEKLRRRERRRRRTRGQTRK